LASRLRSLACVLALSASRCSALQLDDVELRDCRSDLDCYAVRAAALDPHACRRCHDGHCEELAAPRTAHIDTLPAVTWSSAFPGQDRSILVALGTRDPAKPVRGLEIASDGGSRRHAVLYHDAVAGSAQVDAPEQRVEALSLAWFSDRHLIGITLDRAHCPEGRIRVGTSSRTEPFSLSHTGLRTLFRAGVDAADGCSESEGARGARSPAVAAVRRSDRGPEALAVWLAESAAGLAPDEGRCGASTDRFASLRAVRLTLHEDGDDVTFDAAGSPRSFALADAAHTEVSPRVYALSDEVALGAYTLAFVDSEGIQLRVLRAFEDAFGAVPAVAHVNEPCADRIDVSLGAVREGAQTALLVWTCGCDVGTRLRAAVFRLNSDQVSAQSDVFALREGVDIQGSPRIAYSPAGFSATPPLGGWAISWAERSGDEAALRVALVAEADPSIRRDSVITREAVSAAFVYTLAAAPFAYGYLQPAAADEQDLTLTACK
jgi:hypothetical protein